MHRLGRIVDVVSVHEVLQPVHGLRVVEVDVKHQREVSEAPVL